MAQRSIAMIAKQSSDDPALREKLELIRMDEVCLTPEFTIGDGGEHSVLESSPLGNALNEKSVLYKQAFKEYGFDFSGKEVSGLTRKIEGSAIRETLIMAIDNWARSLPDREDSVSESSPENAAGARSNKPDGNQHVTRAELLEIANSVDPIEARVDIRNALVNGDVETIKKMVQANLADQSTELICWIGATLREAGEEKLSADLLCRRQQDSPGDFWLNYEAGMSLASIEGQKLEALVLFQFLILG